MAKEKRLITFTDAHWEMIETMMKEDGIESFSGMVGNTIAEEWKRREEIKNKRPVGRPRKDDGDPDGEFDVEKEFADDLPKNIIYYGTKIGKKQMKYYEDLQKENFKSQG